MHLLPEKILRALARKAQSEPTAAATALARAKKLRETLFALVTGICIGFHGIHRWVTKTDQAPVPSDKSAIQSVTPSQIYAWKG